MPARGATRSRDTRRSAKRRSISAEPEPPAVALDDKERDSEEWAESEEGADRLEESEMEILLTGHAATHGNEAEDNWLIETEEVHWNER